MVTQRVVDQEYTVLNDREIAGTGIGTSPAAVAGYSDLQRAVYQDQPADTAEVAASANAAATSAATAQDFAEQAGLDAADAGARADAAQADADAAQKRADDAYTLADGKVSKNATPTWAAPSGTLTRTALATYVGGTAAATYDPAQMQVLMDSHAAWTQRMAALVTDLIGNDVLKS